MSIVEHICFRILVLLGFDQMVGMATRQCLAAGKLALN